MAQPIEDEPTQERDPGLQPERTSLAWSRTILDYLVIATISLKASPLSGTDGVVFALIYLGLAVVVALRRTRRYGRDLQQMHGGGFQPPVVEVLLLSAVTAGLSLHWLWLVR